MPGSAAEPVEVAGKMLATNVVIDSISPHVHPPMPCSGTCRTCGTLRHRDRPRRSPAVGARLAPWVVGLGKGRPQPNARPRPSYASPTDEAPRAREREWSALGRSSVHPRPVLGAASVPFPSMARPLSCEAPRQKTLHISIATNPTANTSHQTAKSASNQRFHCGYSGSQRNAAPCGAKSHSGSRHVGRRLQRPHRQ